MKKIVTMHKKSIIALIIIFLILIAACLKVGCDLRNILYFSCYQEHNSSYLSDFYADKKVLFMVPHEDDDYNLGGGIIEQYHNAGSDVHIMYMTNGDGYGGGERRIMESALAMSRIGLTADQLIFLGYGDDWDKEEYDHIYYAPEDKVLKSLNGLENTYAGSGFVDFHTAEYGQSALYTRGNIKSDIKAVINKISPDIIYCIECDEHPDHKSLSLLFEECMGEMLAQNSEYRPIVYKGFGYCTGWDGKRDFYADNVLAVAYETDDGTMKLRPQYMWEDRLRFPVAASTLALTEHASSSYVVLDAFSSQDALHNFECLVNSDKVFWERRTDSVLYNATIECNGKETTLLNDFKLSDSENIRKVPKKTKWNQGVCHIAKGDKLNVTLDEPRLIDEIVLYDSPYADNDIIAGVLEFDDGSQIEVSDIRKNGSPSVVKFDNKEISGFTFTVTDSTGDESGLIELEAFGELNKERQDAFVKLMVDDNFAYDYRMSKGDEVKLDVYTYPEGLECEIYIDGKLYADANTLSVSEVNYVYDGKQHTIMAKAVDNEKLYDEAKLYKIDFIDRFKIKLARYIDQKKKG